MHIGVYKTLALCWAGFMLVFWITFWTSVSALFMVVIGTVYAAMAIGVPCVLNNVAHRQKSPSFEFGDFIHGTFDTIYGPVKGSEALLQVILVPLALGIGGIVIGFAIHVARLAH